LQLLQGHLRSREVVHLFLWTPDPPSDQECRSQSVML